MSICSPRASAAGWVACVKLCKMVIRYPVDPSARWADNAASLSNSFSAALERQVQIAIVLEPHLMRLDAQSPHEAQAGSESSGGCTQHLSGA